MKDALGHGSNGSGDGTLTEALRARLSHVSILKGGAVPQSSNASAGAALSGTLQRTQAPVHPSMGGGQSAVRSFRTGGMKHDWSDRPIGDLRPKGH